MKTAPLSMFDRAILLQATGQSFIKLDPRHLMRNPVMFTTAVVALLTSVLFARDVIAGGAVGFVGQIALWLWFTVLFANFAEAVAEGRGKAQADSLRKMRSEAAARRIGADGSVTDIPASQLKLDDVVLVEAGQVIPGDGEVIEGIASVDESAITGESAPVIRESGGDRSAVTGGTRVLSDQIKVRITATAGSSFLDRMIALIEGAERQKTPNEIALAIMIVGMTIIFLIATVTIEGFAIYAGGAVPVAILVALLVTLIPTTIGGLLSAIGIAGMDRLVKFNVLAKSGRAVEAAGDVGALLLDKTGTITLGNRMATAFIAAPGVAERELAEIALLASLADETPEGRSIVALAREKFALTPPAQTSGSFVPFTAQSRMSGVDIDGCSLRKGAVDAVLAWSNIGRAPQAFIDSVERIARSGGTPLAVADNGRLLGVIQLKDIIKDKIKERFAELRRMGIRTVMIT
ncbi:MAG: potassium-transporting ATPase subunit KdpB, partial [Rhodospirillales bacterium]